MKPIWRPDVTLARVREFLPHSLCEHLGIELTELGPDFLTGTMPVDHRTCQPWRMLHGGASVALAESLGSMAANCVQRDGDGQFVGQEINANHVRPVASGSRVTGTARAFHLGRTAQVWGIEIVNEAGRLVCVSRLTLALAGAPPR